MPFSRYQIRNEFSLADPELYKAADKDDPEALLEGVAMAGLVGVLRQLGDLAEFAAEIFHGLHEEVMVTAARGHDLLVRVQQVESDFPAIERAFLSQTGHSAFFSSPGISWHPNMQKEQNLITKGDLPRFVMDSYEECRGPPRLFLLDKFDVAGAGACLKRYTDPSFYKVEASSYELMSVEAQRDKKIRKTKKKGSRWKNGDTPEAFQPSHVKLHQLLLEERVQNGASEPTRRVKLKKRQVKFPYDTENGKGYLEKLLDSPPEDKLVHEVPVGSSFLRLPSDISEEPELKTLEVKIVNSPLDLPMQNGSSHESPSVDKMVSREHLDNGIEEKHVSVDGEQRDNGIEDEYHSDDVASETENYMDALATMESEVETDAEIKADKFHPFIKQESFSDPNVEKLHSKLSDSQSASDDESSSLKNKISTFSYSDTLSTSPENMSPRAVNSSQPFATTEIPFRPRVPRTQVSAHCTEIRDNAVDQETILKESTSKESDLSEIASANFVDVDIPTKKEEIEMHREEIVASTREVDKDDNYSNSNLENSNEEEQTSGPTLEKLDICDVDEILESKSDPAEARVSYSSEDESESKDKETESVESESKDANAVVCDPDDKKVNNLSTLEEEESMVREPESVKSETKDLNPDSSEIEGLSNFVNTELEGKEEDSVDSEKNEDTDVSITDASGENGLEFKDSDITQKSIETVEKDLSEQAVISAEKEEIESGEKDLSEESVISPVNETIESAEKDESSEQSVISPEKETIESGEEKFLSEESVVSPEKKTIESAEKDELNEQSVLPPGNETIEYAEKDGLSEQSVIYPENEMIESGDKKELNELSVISPENEMIKSGENKELNEQTVVSPQTDSIPSATCNDLNENDVDSPSAHSKSLQDETLFVIGKPDKNGPQEDQYAQFLDSAPASPVSAETQESDNQNENDQTDKLEAASSILNQSVLIEEKADQLESLDSQNQDNQSDELEAASSILNQSVSIEEKADQLESLDSQNQDDQSDELEAASPLLNQSVSLEEKADQIETLDSQNQDDQSDKLEAAPSFLNHSVSLEEKADRLETLDSQNRVDHPECQDHLEPSMADLSQLSSQINLSSFNILPELAPITLEEMPPLPPLPPMQWRMGKLHNSSLISRPDNGQHEVNNLLPVFPQTESHLPLDHNENATHEESQQDYKHLNTQEDGNSVNGVKFAQEIVPKSPLDKVESQYVSTSGTEIIMPSSTSILPPVDDERPNGIRPMKVQRPRTPLIDAVAAHDINKLRKVSERATPLFPKEEERDTFLEQIRAQSFNLKPAVPTRPIIQGPSTNLRVAAILEKANAIRQAFAGSDDDEDDNDSWSDS